ncbi:MAG: tRNA (adenosine(37)-N6)-dimethylallyltransferase MiaA, partial [Bacteroidales bacterium]|nr:tRNA (adenosine(37)-N6)-dimethylallyltransferase MiaA [Bacteroidales bacterium]
GQRVVRALEVCLMTGRPFSSFKTHPDKKRPVEIEKRGLTRPREILYERINQRVLQMIDEGLMEEVRALSPHRQLTALQTVGYKELFPVLDGEYSLERGIELVQRNTRHYAKRQMTWWGRDKSIIWQEI